MIRFFADLKAFLQLKRKGALVYRDINFKGYYANRITFKDFRKVLKIMQD